MTTLKIVDAEIVPKGKCYVICTAYDAADFDTAVAGACEYAASKGARSLHLAVQDDSYQLTADAYGICGRQFAFDTSFDILQKTLDEKEPANILLRTKRVIAGNAALFCAIYNEVFFYVPNSQTMEDAEICAIIDDDKRDAGFFMRGGDPVGIFALDYREDVPEISAVGIRAEYRRQGYGRRALHTLELRLREEGYDFAQLLVAQSNSKAYALYRSEGYRFTRQLSRWYATKL